MINLQSLFFLVLAFEDFACLDEEYGRDAVVYLVFRLAVSHLRCFLQAFNGFVELVDVSVGVAQCSCCRRADHLVVRCGELFKILHRVVPFFKIGVAETGIKVGKVACVGAAVIGSDVEKSGKSCAVSFQSLLILLVGEVVLTLCQSCACLLFSRSRDVSVVANDACHNENYRNNHDRDCLFVLHEDSLFLTEGLVCRALLLIKICHLLYFYFIISCLQSVAKLQILSHILKFMTDFFCFSCQIG